MASPMVQVNVRVTPELHARLIAEADSTDTTVTAVVTKALERFFVRRSNGKGEKG